MATKTRNLPHPQTYKTITEVGYKSNLCVRFEILNQLPELTGEASTAYFSDAVVFLAVVQANFSVALDRFDGHSTYDTVH